MSLVVLGALFILTLLLIVETRVDIITLTVDLIYNQLHTAVIDQQTTQVRAYLANDGLMQQCKPTAPRQAFNVTTTNLLEY